jgi:hypothetical protein
MIRQFVFGFLILITTGVVGQDLTATQNVPTAAAAGSSFTVEININRGSINGFMKFFQELPPGFTATEIDSKGGSFSFADNGAKVVWIAPPNEPTYTISYKVTVPPDAAGPKVLNAKFSYINNNERKIFEFEPKTISIGGSGTVASGSNPVKSAQTASNTPAKVSTPIVEKTPPASVPADKTATSIPSTKPATPPANTPAKEANTEIVQKKETVIPPAVKASAGSTTGKTYRVQIGAFSSKPKLGDVQDITTVVLDNGITKYFSGNFATVEEATKRKEEVAKKGFPGAFVVAFENGKISK